MFSVGSSPIRMLRVPQGTDTLRGDAPRTRPSTTILRPAGRCVVSRIPVDAPASAAPCARAGGATAPGDRPAASAFVTGSGGELVGGGAGSGAELVGGGAGAGFAGSAG